MKTILVVEDNPVNMRLVRLMLRAHGFAVWEAATGLDALSILRRSDPRPDSARHAVARP